MTGGFSELWKYSTATMMWTQLYLVVGAGGMGMAPSARSGHGMAAVGEDVYVFGGRDDEYPRGKVKGGEGRIGHAWLPCIVCHLGGMSAACSKLYLFIHQGWIAARAA